jgi:Bacterial PH domain
LRNGKADLFAVQRAFSDMILGTDDVVIPDIDKKEGHVAHTSVGLFTWDNNRPMDAVEMNNLFHSSPNILQPSEIVELAFKCRRDILLFTTRRLIKCDRQGLTGKSVEYTSFPWFSILAFSVKTAGTYLDFDSELVIYTEIMYEPAQGEDVPAEPGMAEVEFDFQKGVINILDIQMYMSKRILGVGGGVAIPSNEILASRPEQGLENLLSRLFDDRKPIDSVELNREFHTTSPLLVDGEDVVMAFKAGRDLTVFTNKRIISIDTQGLTGKKKQYLSIPYKSVRAFAVESAGK